MGNSHETGRGRFAKYDLGKLSGFESPNDLPGYDKEFDVAVVDARQAYDDSRRSCEF